MRKTPLKNKGKGLKKTGFFKFGDNSTLGLVKKPIRGAYKALKKQSDKYVEGKEERIENGRKMMELFNLHWETHPDKKCESCGVQLWGENLTLYHEHLLPKGNLKYKHLSLEIDNLFLICPPCHALSTGGIFLPKHLEAIEKAKKQFNL